MPFAPRKADAREHPNAGDKWGRHELRGKQVIPLWHKRLSGVAVAGS